MGISSPWRSCVNILLNPSRSLRSQTQFSAVTVLILTAGISCLGFLMREFPGVCPARVRERTDSTPPDVQEQWEKTFPTAVLRLTGHLWGSAWPPLPLAVGFSARLRVCLPCPQRPSPRSVTSGPTFTSSCRPSFCSSQVHVGLVVVGNIYLLK